MHKHLKVVISGLAVVSLILVVGFKSEGQSDPDLTYELEPSISLVEGKLILTPGLSYNNPAMKNYKMIRETLTSTDNVNFHRYVVFEDALGSCGSCNSSGPIPSDTVSVYVHYSLLCDGEVISREWRKVDAPDQTQEQPSKKAELTENPGGNF